MIAIVSRVPVALVAACLLYGATASEAVAQTTAPAPLPPPPAAAPAPTPPAPMPPPAAAPPPPVVVAPAPPPPAMPPPPPPAMAPVVAPDNPPPPVAPAAPAAPAMKPISIGVGMRAGFILQDPNQHDKMSEVHLDTTGAAYANAGELRLNGDVTDYFGWTFNVNAVLDGGGLATSATLGIEDLIARFKASDGFQIWAGRLLVPSDRANFSGPFFQSPWNYPGFYKAGAPLGPMEGANGRNQGVTIWGNLAEDKFKYFIGAYGVDQGGASSTAKATDNAFYSARISYNLQGEEPGYFGSSTYYGDKSVVQIGLAGQYQHDGSIDQTTLKPKDTVIGMADFLAEEATGTGTYTFEGQFYAFNDGYNFGPALAPHEAFYALVSYLTPENVGVGKIQPLLRWQQTIGPAWTIVDAAVAYVMKEYDARLVLTYEHIDEGSTLPKGNGLQFGVQLQK